MRGLFEPTASLFEAVDFGWVVQLLLLNWGLLDNWLNVDLVFRLVLDSNKLFEFYFLLLNQSTGLLLRLYLSFAFLEPE